MIVDSSLFFFFQAEDCIRALIVTGVQTCALPISAPARSRSAAIRSPICRCARAACRATTPRSEERRVGKECRSRWSPDPEKKQRRGNTQSDCFQRNTKVFHKLYGGFVRD